MHTLLSAIFLVRPHNVMAAVLSTLVGFRLSGASGVPWDLLMAIAFAVASGNVINDFYDRDIDMINKPHRPIPSGVFSPGKVKFFYASLLCAMVVLLFFVDVIGVIWIVSLIVLLHLYSAILKRVYLIGNLLVSAVASSGFLLGAAKGGDIKEGVIPAILSFLFMLGRELVKDCEDMDGDYACGAKTVPVISGRGVALVSASIIFVILMVLFPLPYFAGVYGKGYLVIIFISMVPILIVSTVFALKDKSLGTVSLLLKIGMFFGITGFYVSTI
jgi:geranylgeranylglycerol-phosphate geranylgeranyltransferase